MLTSFRPPEIHIGELMFYHGFFFLFFSYPQSSLNGTQRKLATWSEVSAIWKCMSKIWGIPSPTNWGPKTTFWRLCNVMAILMAYIFGANYDIDNRVSALITTIDLFYRTKMSWTLVHKRVKIGLEFSSTSVNSVLCFVDRRCTQRSANGTQPNCLTEGGKWHWCEPNKVAPHSECKWNHPNEVAVVLGPQKPFCVSNGTPSGGLQWRYVVNCHIF